MIDCGGRTLMPGLIDSHVHVVPQRGQHPLPRGGAADADDRARRRGCMRGMLDRGFTTVRDTGGADWGIKTAVEQG